MKLIPLNSQSFMAISIIISFIVILVIFIVLKTCQRRYQGFKKSTAEEEILIFNDKPFPFSNEEIITLPAVNNALETEEVWWKKLSDFQQLHLALFLAKKTLPVWERFTALRSASYRTTSTGGLITIERDILQKTIEEVIIGSKLNFPDSDNKKIVRLYNNFIEPVIALHDGLWVCTYPVKKIFFTVYSILQSIVEQKNLAVNDSQLSKAISSALECMEMSKLYSKEEIASFLQPYKCL